MSNPGVPRQFRSNWVVDPHTGTYDATIRSPTGIASDPPLAGHGEEQARQLARHVLTLDPPVDRIYSSPWYRCLQTLQPLMGALDERGCAEQCEVRGEHGLGEWYGSASFSHPSPASRSLLASLFPFYSVTYQPVTHPSTTGETIRQLHDRVAQTLSGMITRLDEEPGGPKAVLLCTHAATLIAMGRVLTGHMPADLGEPDFKPFTCGLSKFVRRSRGNYAEEPGEWKGKGVAGGWDCVLNGDCHFLTGGEERGW
ncbi:MAG: hypothetical protein M1833_006993 [Piccolia ochrophora]|nr:MAG: hypothetical protein M1833_006993 [Piccolia ochrophora]